MNPESPTPGTRHDARTDQYVPTLGGKDISPTSFSQERALSIAQTAARTPERKTSSKRNTAKKRVDITPKELVELCTRSLLALHEDDFPVLREQLRDALARAEKTKFQKRTHRSPDRKHVRDLLNALQTLTFEAAQSDDGESTYLEVTRSSVKKAMQVEARVRKQIAKPIRKHDAKPV